MYKILCVTNRKLCVGNFTDRISELHKNDVTVILREKDLSEDDYTILADKIIRVCPDIILHTHIWAAERLGTDRIHIPMSMSDKYIMKKFNVTGVSVHSADEAVKAEIMGADYITAGHVFETDCKKGLAPRGTGFLKKVSKSVNIPVYGIGGIKPDNIEIIRKSGALGACIMSGFMQCENVEKYLIKLNRDAIL